MCSITSDLGSGNLSILCSWTHGLLAMIVWLHCVTDASYKLLQSDKEAVFSLYSGSYI